MTAAEQLEAPKRPRVEPGWYRDMSNEDYHSSNGTSSTRLKILVEQTPAHLLHYMMSDHPESDAMRLGTAVHSLVLEPETAESEIAVMPEGLNLRTKAGREERDRFVMENHQSTILTTEQYEAAMRMAQSVFAHPNASILFQDIIAESSVFWWYQTGDIDDEHNYRELLKVRPDALNPAHSVIVDLKSTRDAGYSAFIRSIQNLHYHLSAAMYLDGVNRCRQLLDETGRLAYRKFVFVCVENTPPYECAVYELGSEYLELGKHLYRRAMRELSLARENEWPGFPEEIRVLEPPPWANRVPIV